MKKSYFILNQIIICKKIVINIYKLILKKKQKLQIINYYIQ